jgi:hypothetical protein
MLLEKEDLVKFGKYKWKNLIKFMLWNKCINQKL